MEGPTPSKAQADLEPPKPVVWLRPYVMGAGILIPPDERPLIDPGFPIKPT